MKLAEMSTLIKNIKMFYKQKNEKNGVWTLHAALVNLFKVKHGWTDILSCEIFMRM